MLESGWKLGGHADQGKPRLCGMEPLGEEVRKFLGDWSSMSHMRVSRSMLPKGEVSVLSVMLR